jgi:hypothetical protein
MGDSWCLTSFPVKSPTNSSNTSRHIPVLAVISEIGVEFSMLPQLDERSWYTKLK